MTDAAVIQGAYADLKLIRSRKVAVVCIEIPIERASEFVASFGIPNAESETWVAVARLDQSAKPDKPKREFKSLPRSQQAALACQREAFQRFCHEMHGADFSEEGAASRVRDRCGVKSRSDLNYPVAGIAWDRLYENFESWLNDPAQAA